MTDNQGLVPNNVALPSDLNFRLKPSAPRGRSMRVSVLPTNKSTFNPSDTIVAYIPCGRRNTFLDCKSSYLKFTVNNNDTNNTLNFDGSAGSVLNRLDVFHASNNLESIQNLNLLYSYLFDFQLNQSEKYSQSNAYGFANNVVKETTTGYSFVTSGIANAALAAATNLVLTAANTAVLVGMIVQSPKSDSFPNNITVTAVAGAAITLSANVTVAQNAPILFFTPSNTILPNTEALRAGAQLGISGGNNNCLTVALPIISGVIGLGNDHYLPVGALSDDIRLEFTLEAQALGMVYGSANAAQVAWTVTGVELELTYIELSDEAMSMVNEYQNLRDTTFLCGNSWRHYVSTLPANQGGVYSALVPMRFASTKSFCMLPRPNATISSATAYSLSSRCNPQIQSWWIRAGSSLIPQKNIVLQNDSKLVVGYVEAWQEIQKSFHNLNNIEMSGTIGFDYYNVADIAQANATCVSAYSTGANSYKNGFACGLELETYANKSSVLLSGLNSLSFQTFFECNLQSTGPAQAYTLDYFVNFDLVIVKDQAGILSVRM